MGIIINGGLTLLIKLIELLLKVYTGIIFLVLGLVDMIHVYHIAGQILSIKVLVTFLTVLKKEKFAFHLLIFANKQWQKIA